jgi:dihydrofolate reductase
VKTEAGSRTRRGRAPRISIIAAMAKNRVIGANNRIPWRLPGELQLFKSITMGHHIVMGRKTWESIARLLPGRTTVIVTRQHGYHVAGAKIVSSLDDAIAVCGDDEEAFVIGGGELYAAALPLADRIYLTTVDADIAGDTRMPSFDAARWRAGEIRDFCADEKNPYNYRLTIYDRKKE